MTKTTKEAVQGLADLLTIRYLILEAARAATELPSKLKGAEPGYAVLLELEPHFYLGCASILLSATFGKPDTKMGKLAYAALKEIVKKDSVALRDVIPQNGCFCRTEVRA